MEKSNRKPNHLGRVDPVGKPVRREDLGKESNNGTKEETSDEDEVVNYPNQPPIQNGFVVFIHQLNLATTTKEKRTVVEWISDALKMLDISPEIITVDKLMEQSIATCSKPKVPIIKFSRPTAEVENATMKDNGNSSKPNRINAKVSPSKRKIKIDKSRTLSAAPGTNGQSQLAPTWKQGKVLPQKIANTSSSKSLQRKSGRPVKLHQMEDKKQEFGVQLTVLREKVRALQSENHNCIWVLLVESRRRCIVDMGKLNALASKFRFKVRWIAAQAPRSLDQSVFSVVNDIVQTKNICFPEQMKGTRRKDKDTTPDGKQKHGKLQTSKALDVEVLHKTMSSQFDVSSYASFDIDQTMKTSEAPSGSVQPLDNSLKSALGKIREEPEEEKSSGSGSAPQEALEKTPEKKPGEGPPVQNSDSNETATTKSDSSSLFEIRSSNKNYTTLYNTAVQMALISINNPFASPFTRTDLPDFHGLPAPSDLKKKEFTLTKALDENGNEVFEIPTASRAVVVVVRDMTQSHSGLATLLKNMLRREGIPSYTISVPDLLSQPKALELMDSFALNGGYDPERDVTIGCKILIQRGLNYKLNENRHKVVIVDVGDESFVRMWSVYNYGVKLGHKCLILEKKMDGAFENNLKRVFQITRRRFRRQNLCTWPSNRHSATTASREDFLFKPESIDMLGKTLSINREAVLSAKSVRFAVNASKLQVCPDLGRTSIHCFLQHANEDTMREDSKSTRGIKSSSCLDSHGLSIEANLRRILRHATGRSIINHTELPDILGGTSSIKVETPPDKDNFSTQADKSEKYQKDYLDEENSDGISYSEVSIHPEDTDDGDPLEPLEECGSTMKTSSLTDSENSSVDSNFLAALKESALVGISDGNYLLELSEEYPVDGHDTDDTYVSVPKSRDIRRLDSLRVRSSQKQRPYNDPDDDSATSDCKEGDDRLREIHPNKVISSSRSSLGKPRKKLLEIHRCKNKNRGMATTSSASEENLFKGWVALPEKDSKGRENDKGFFLRTHYRLTGLLHRLCSCGRKVHKKK